jgi:hypothetical protein
MSDLAKISDSALDYLRGQLEAKVGALRSATSAIGSSLLEQYRSQLDKVRAEIERRSSV